MKGEIVHEGAPKPPSGRHRCDPDTNAEDYPLHVFPIGTIWRCECGRLWRKRPYSISFGSWAWVSPPLRMWLWLQRRRAGTDG